MINTITGLFSGVVSLGKTSPLKLGMIIVLIGMIGSGILWTYYEIQSGGFNKCLVKVEENSKKVDTELLVQLQSKIEKLEKDKIITNKNLESAHKTIDELAKKRDGLEYEINNMPVDINCEHLGSKHLRMFNKSIGDAPIIKSHF